MPVLPTSTNEGMRMPKIHMLFEGGARSVSVSILEVLKLMMPPTH